jgi:hypothetical protein
LLSVAIFAVYLAFLHPWLMAWGATAEEQRMVLPGDELIPDGAPRITRAITIDAPAERVWPWLLQIGQDRAGFYSYDWLENLVTGDIHNADAIHGEWQQRAVGDKVPMARADILGGRLGDAIYLPVKLVEPGRAIGNVPCMLVLQRVDADTTRLLCREAVAPDPSQPAEGIGGKLFQWLVWDPMHFVVEGRMLLGIKARAEGRVQPAPLLGAAARLGWLAAGVAVLGLFLARRRWWPWLLLPLVAASPALLKTGDFDAALVGFLAVGLTVLGALAFGRRWWAPYTTVAALVLLTLLLATDAYIAFGLVFFVLSAGALVWVRRARRRGMGLL